MSDGADARFLVLHGLRLKGFGEPDAVAAAVGLDRNAAEEHLAKLQAEDLVVRRDGRLSGWALTREGRAEQERLARADLANSGALDAVRAAYDRFLALNDPFKVLCTDWQVRDGDLYDRTDVVYNDSIFSRLREVDARLTAVLADLAAALPRFAVYQDRFATALRRLLGGELDYLTKPIIDSYHTIWFELHEDLITGLGLDRSQEGSF
jgi:DNA-binding MarR family transcriptional regulator